jgi:flagellar motor switch protein FliM
MSQENIITQEELNRLLSSLEAGAQNEKPGPRPRKGQPQIHEARVHDFAGGEKLSRDAIKSLNSISMAFAHGISGVLTNYVHKHVNASLLSLEQETYDQFCRSVPDPTVSSVFSLAPIPGQAILELNPAIAFWMLDCLLGGAGDIPSAPRPVTDVEKALLEGVIGRLLIEMAKAWESVASVAPSLINIETSVAEVEIAQPSDAVVVSSFEVSTDTITGMASVCIPALSLKLSEIDIMHVGCSSQSEISDPDLYLATIKQNLAQALQDIPVACSVRLGTTALTAEILENLQVGDVLCMEQSAREPLEMLVHGTPKFDCQPLSVDGGLAVKILGDCLKTSLR